MFIALTVFAQKDRYSDRQIAKDDSWHYSNVGNLGLSISNLGIYGQGYNNPDQPSCMYKLHSSLYQEIIEHFSYAGIWIGGMKNGQIQVSTAIYDGIGVSSGDNSGRGQEFTTSSTAEIKFNPVFELLNSKDRRFDLSRVRSDSVVIFNSALQAPIEDGYAILGSTEWDTIITRSSIRDASVNNPYANYAQFFDPEAISHQDLLCAFTDTNTVVPRSGITIPDHTPLGVHVVQEAYSWYDPFADAFTILNYKITNIPAATTDHPIPWMIAPYDTTVEYQTSSAAIPVEFQAGDTIWFGDVIEQPYFGMWVDASVGNTIYTPPSNYDPSGGPGGRWYWYDNLNDYDSTGGRHIAIQWDADGDAGWAQSYVGASILGAEPRTDEWDVYYHQWPWQGSSQQQSHADNFPMPTNEEERYGVMGSHISYETIPTAQSDEDSWMMLISCGPMPDLIPGSSYNVTMAFVCGLWNGSASDGPERRENLYRNADWAQIAYNGEDKNGNGVLDPGEDNDNDGKITRFILPAAPPSPQLVVVPGDNNVSLYWNNMPEFTIDPISNLPDFEGYRIYGAPKTEGLGSEWSLLAEFDVDTSAIGFNTGMQDILLEEPMIINGVTVYYKWTNYGVKNGWPRELYYSVTAFDRGNAENELPSLESPLNANRTYAFPGTPAADDEDKRVSVYPNPYYGRAQWDGYTGRDRLIWFRYLPAECTVTIFTLAGEKVDQFYHNSGTYSGADVQRITTGSTPSERRSFSGGEHAWDLLTEDDQEIATGLYVYTVKNHSNGDVKTGKFMVVKGE